MEETHVRFLFREPEQYAGQEVIVRGWVRTNRGNNRFGFIELNDGSFFKSVQIVYENSDQAYGSSITLKNMIIDPDSEIIYASSVGVGADDEEVRLIIL